MVSASRVALVALRIWELICSVIVVGILGHFLYIVSDAGATNDGRAVYSLVVASISTVFSLVFIAPFMYSFLAFPVDFALFVMWLVAFCLLETRTGIHTCSSPWYWNYWGYYWGGYGSSPGTAGSGYRRSTGAAGSGCGAWRTVLAFSFMAMFAFLVSTILGATVVYKYWTKMRRGRYAGIAGRTDPATSEIGGTARTGGVVGTVPGTAPGTAPAVHTGSPATYA